MDWVRIPPILKQVNPGLIWNMPGDQKVLYLTFDDGPTPAVTGEVLSILARYKSHATFFCIGRNAERHPEIYRQITTAGHGVGNHTYSHLKGWFTRNREYYSDILLASQFVPSGLFRPAYGMITPVQAQRLKKQFRIVMWDVMSYDFHPKTNREKCLDNVIRYAKPGSVIVFHDSVKASEKVLYALPGVLEYFKERGFSFESIPKAPA
jgi:peptidoglycan/xylan/chitin deacetylase (PgdA/CDA1 family)